MDRLGIAELRCRSPGTIQRGSSYAAMSLSALQKWCAERGLRCARENQPMNDGFVRVIIHAELDCTPVFSELIVPANDANAVADELAAGMLVALRSAP